MKHIWTVNDWLKLLVAGTMCLALLGVVWMAVQKTIEPMVVVTFVLTTITGIVTGVGLTYANKANEQGKQEAFQSGVMAQTERYAAAMRQYDGLKVGK